MTAANALPTARLYAYGVLAIPLAMLMLPVYVHVPKFYADQFGLALGTQGLLLVAARGFDALQDPWLGHLSDRARGIDRRAWILGGAPLLACASYGLFAPPAWAHAHIAWWFVCMLMLVYTALALVQINHQTYGAELSHTAHERTRITAIREGLGLLGVLAGVLLPAWCVLKDGPQAGYGLYAMMVAGLLLTATIISVHLSPAPLLARDTRQTADGHWRAMLRPLANARFRHLLAVFLLNGTANAIPATLVLFYIDDVIGRADLAPAFLCSYFLAGAVAMPLWPWLARHTGQQRAWLLGMLTAIAAFLCAAFLGEGEVLAYFAVCLLSGLALGADLALPPALLAGVIDHDTRHGQGSAGGAYFGLWTLVTKLSLALAAGIALPLLAVSGYSATSNVSAGSFVGLALLYALLPCVLKAGACAVLLRGVDYGRPAERASPAWP